MSLETVSEIVWKKCLNLGSGQKALVVTDKNLLNERQEIGQALREIAGKITDCDLVRMEEINISGEEPPEDIANEMVGRDAIVVATSKSISHTKAVINAISNGARVATMPGITKDMFLRAVDVDYDEMKRYGESIIQALSDSNELNLTTTLGTDIYIMIGDRKIHNEFGILDRPKLCNLPSGEVAFAPIEGKSEGKIVIDLTSLGQRVKSPFKITVEKGDMVDCENQKLWRILSEKENGFNLAELGVGTNTKAKITGKILEDEKVRGTAHFAFGTNVSIGGNVYSSIHLDNVFSKPTIRVENKILIQEGKLVF